MRYRRDSDTFIEFVVLGALVFSALGASYAFSSMQCNAKGDMMMKTTKYGIAIGCMVEHKPGEWIPLNAYRVID